MPTFTTATMRADEEPIFFALYSAVRSEELGMHAWDAPMRDRILRLQFAAQRSGYRQQYPASVEQFILRDGQPIGWITIDRTGAVVRCVDIAILSEERRQGAATRALRELQEEAAAAALPVVLSVRRTNAPALRLYDRLGFQAVGETDVHVVLEWHQVQPRAAGGATV